MSNTVMKVKTRTSYLTDCWKKKRKSSKLSKLNLKQHPSLRVLIQQVSRIMMKGKTVKRKMKSKKQLSKAPKMPT